MHGAFDLDTIAGWCSGADYWGWRWTSSNAQLDFDSVDFVWQQQHRRSIVCSQQWCSGMCIAAVAPQQQQQYQPWIFANAIAWWLMAFGVTLIWINDILEHAYRLHSLLIYLSVWVASSIATNGLIEGVRVAVEPTSTQNWFWFERGADQEQNRSWARFALYTVPIAVNRRHILSRTPTFPLRTMPG